jgi:arginyl-tRNA synthetase
VIKETIEQAVRAALTELGAGDTAFVVSRPGEMTHGDFATNAALAAVKLLKNPPAGGPKEVAQALAEKLSIQGVEKVEVAGAGFINFFLAKETLAQELESAAKDASYGNNTLYKGKTVLVEYTSPNLFKPLHIGNLVGNVLGESVARLFEASGATVHRLNYPSDIGLTVAKGVWGLWKNKLDPKDITQLGKAYVAGNAAYEDGSAKSEIEEINRALYENSNAEWSALRTQGIETSKRHLDELCRKLGTQFDSVFFESQSGPHGREIVTEQIGKVFEKSEGAVVFHGAHTRVFLNSQGLPTYEAKEVGLFDLKMMAYPNFDTSITVTGSEQKEFFAVVFDAIKKIFPDHTNGKELRHISNGFLKLTTGKMSSRLGNVITGESLIEDLEDEAKEKMQGRELTDTTAVAEQVAIAAIKYTVLKQGSGKDIVFDPEKSLSLEGDSGPYLQYAHVRASSLIKKASDAEVVEDASAYDSFALSRLLVHYPDALLRAAQELEPHHVTTYLTELASAFNSWYAAERVIVDGKVSSGNVVLIKAVKNILSSGLQTLGIPAPEEM